MSINIQTLKQLRIFEDSCLAPSSGGLALLSQGGSAPSALPSQKDFGEFDYKQIAKEHGILDLYNMLNNDFITTFDMNSVRALLDDIDKIKTDILVLNKDINIIYESSINIPIFPIKYDKTKYDPMYIIGDSEMTPEQFNESLLYSKVHILPYAYNIKDGLNYPEFNSVIEMLETELIPKSSIIIQNVLGNGECLFSH